MSESIPIMLPQSVPFPVIISSILCKIGDKVEKHDLLFKYKYWDYQDDPNCKEDIPRKIRVERIGTFESPIEGQIQSIDINDGQEVSHSGVELCWIKEPCSHTVQYGGLCALCGKAVEDEKDYSGYNYEERATISMSHDNTDLKISLDEAKKIEENTTTRLVEDRKLILVVDLDQTVIQATVDPTVSEWQSDPNNPNYPAIKDVKSFCLEEESPQGWNGLIKCWYYVKIRPGLAEFLLEISKKYELHIYTMATRNYALAIAKIIDPTGQYFGDRILSRDESGSLTHKNLKRLFPVDQSMVAIIDDRGDVWQWESNLIKVVPYNFFVGIGDINSTFLPKKLSQLTGPSKKRKAIARLEAQQDLDSDTSFEDSNDNKIVEIKENDNKDEDDDITLLKEQSITRIQSIEKQQHDRPLAKLQHNLEQMHHHDHESKNPSPIGSPENSEDEDEEDNLLYDDDNELYSLKNVLKNIHQEYYTILDTNKSKNISLKPDLTKIIPVMKSKVLQGITVLFSGIIPLGIKFENEDIVIWAKQFGVKVVNEVYPEVTHVICRDPANGPGPTFKARVAVKLLPNAKLVNPDWLFACLSSWSKVDEKDYLISTSDKSQWYVKENDIEKYKLALESQSKVRDQQSKSNHATENAYRPRFDSFDSIEEYDLDEANQEVDDFLADISDDDDFDDNTNGNGYADDDDDNNDDQDEKSTQAKNSFIKNMYENPKKRSRELDVDEEDDEENDNLSSNGKRVKVPSTDSEDKELTADLLEQELLDRFEDLEDE